MTQSLHGIQRQIVARISERPVGSASRFSLMDAADAVSKAIEAEVREGSPIAVPLTADEAGRLQPGDLLLIGGRLVREFSRFEAGWIYASSSSLGHRPEHCAYLGPAGTELPPALQDHAA